MKFVRLAAVVLGLAAVSAAPAMAEGGCGGYQKPAPTAGS